MDEIELKRRAGLLLSEEQLEEATFTRQHFVATANILNKVQDMNLRRELSDMFVALFQQSNPNFDIARWNKAVGLGA